VSLRRHVAAAAIAALAAGLAPTTAACADELAITAQSVLAHGEFLTQAPPPPAQGVLCVVDSGVDVNPDTEPILAGRESVFGGTVDDVTGYHHGTYVAMVAGAAANGWGMVGAWPRLKVLSIRALAEGSDHLSGDAYREGIARCVSAKVGAGVDVRAIELAIGGPPSGRTASELAEIQDSIARATQNGIVVISAAGNDGGPVNAPASLGDVLAVGAADKDGAFCGFSSRGSELGLAALGCGMNVATAPAGAPGMGQSTSLASGYVSGAVVALRSYRPDLSAGDTRALLNATSSIGMAGRILNIAAAFRAAGLGSLVDAYRPPSPPSASPPPTTVPQVCDARRRVCSRPLVVRTRLRGNRILIRLKVVPKSHRVVVRVDGHLRLRTRSRVISLRVRRFRNISIRFARPGLRASLPVVVRRSEVKA
jgi:hypothetical protein